MVRIVPIAGAAQAEIVHILLAIAIGGIGFVNVGRQKVSPNILDRVVSGYDAFQPCAVRGVYRSRHTLGNERIIRLVIFGVQAASGEIMVQAASGGNTEAEAHIVYGPVSFP